MQEICAPPLFCVRHLFYSRRAVAALAMIGALTACPADKASSPTAEKGEQAKADSQPATEEAKRPAHVPVPHVPTPINRDDEKHLANVTQLTHGGENAEAYFDVSGQHLIFQSTRDDLKCDQIFRMKADGSEVKQVSVPGGRTTCGYIQTDDSIVYASTHGHGLGCLPSPDHSEGYVWPLYPEMDIWRAQADGSEAKVLFQSKGYDAEATICHRDGRIIFTSTQNGDLDLYVMDRAGKNVKQLTDTPGYDGGAFFSEDCSKIVWRASRPHGEKLKRYQALLKRGLVKPSKLEIFVMDADGKNVVQVTNNGMANFAPYLHPDNKRVLYVSNKADRQPDGSPGRNFDIFLVDLDGKNEKRITFGPTFDGFPMFNRDATRIVFASNRGNKKRGETNVFIADWKE